MTVERLLRMMAGLFVVVSAALAAVHSPWWLVLTGFVGLNLLQSSFTNWCPAVWLFEKLGFARCEARPASRAGSTPAAAAS